MHSPTHSNYALVRLTIKCIDAFWCNDVLNQMQHMFNVVALLRGVDFNASSNTVLDALVLYFAH